MCCPSGTQQKTFLQSSGRRESRAGIPHEGTNEGRPRAPTWVLLERGVTPGPGNCATCLSVLMLLGYEWEWVRLA